MANEKLSIKRDRTRVLFIIDCEDECAAIEMYEQAARNAFAGGLNLTLTLTERMEQSNG